MSFFRNGMLGAWLGYRYENDTAGKSFSREDWSWDTSAVSFGGVIQHPESFRGAE